MSTRYLHHVGKKQDRFLDVFAREVLPEVSVTTARTSDLWWKNAVIYCLDVETFLDWDGDGIGDLRGLTERIDHLAGIGVSCIWLMPFQPSPNRDDGYDITDYYGVDERLRVARRLRRADPDREGPRDARDRRPRREPHVGQAPVVPRREYVADLAVPGLLRVGGRAARRTEEPRSSSPTPRTASGRGTRRPASTTCRYYSHQPDLNIANPKVRGGNGSSASGSSSASTASGWTPCRSSSRRAASRARWTSTRTTSCGTSGRSCPGVGAT